jgi:hypothetical protein
MPKILDKLIAIYQHQNSLQFDYIYCISLLVFSFCIGVYGISIGSAL